MFGFTFSDILQVTASALTDGSVYAVVGLCFMVVYRTTHILNFAQGDFVMLGGVLMFAISQRVDSFFIGFVITMVAVGIIGGLVERLGNRVFVKRKASVFVQSFATIGASLIIQTAALLAYGHEPLALPPFSSDSPIFVLGAPILPQSLWVMGFALVIFVGAKIGFDHTRIGTAMRACADNPVGAAVIGIEKTSMVRNSFVIGAGLSGAIGIAITPIYYTGYWTGTLFTIKGFIAAVLGGMYNPFGAVIGGLALGLLENLGASFISSGYKDIISLMVLIGVLLFRRRRRSSMEASE
ncbi:MAG: branched-chain amino acid ABC transporter permease [Desulfobacterales bacterium]|nr:branched-chain amino acid ABC transporter permease [Desulfobacterales bacterium]